MESLPVSTTWWRSRCTPTAARDIEYRRIANDTEYHRPSSSRLDSSPENKSERVGKLMSDNNNNKLKTNDKNTTNKCVDLHVQAMRSSFDEMILSPRKLLDRLLIMCPNTDYCSEVIPRRDLQLHLIYRCKGTVTSCVNANIGCDFQSPRGALHKHLEECIYNDKGSLPSYSSSLPSMFEDQLTTLQVYRGNQCLGMSIVGGVDTPLISIIVQDVFKNGAIYKDGRLQPGDQILEVNGVDLTTATHLEAVRALLRPCTICQLVIYREPSDDSSPRNLKEETLSVTLPKVAKKQLGIKLVQKNSQAGLYILEIIPGGIAYWDNRMRADDRILQINGVDMLHGSQEKAVEIIQGSVDEVEFLLSRQQRRHSPSHDIFAGPQDGDPLLACPPTARWEKVVTVAKDESESLGISIAGGRVSGGYDTPIYVTNMQPDGLLEKTGQIAKGDVLLAINGVRLLGLTHNEAVQVLKSSSDSTQLLLQVIPSTEIPENVGNFRPSWKFWLSMPSICYSVKVMTLERSPSGSLGFSIVGGYVCRRGAVPVFVKSVVPTGPAGVDARLQSGDMLLSVNGQSLDGATHGDAVLLLTTGSPNPVVLNVISWPGSPV